MVDWQQVQRGERIYKTPNNSCCVYRGVYGAIPVVLKVLTFDDSPDEVENIENEVLLQMSFEHPKVCKVYGYHLEGNRQATIMLEPMESDLFKEIGKRNRNHTPWSDPELIYHFQSLINVFAEAQRAGICHRDIKPQNIFMKENELYVADFGCAKQVDANDTSTVKGSPYFFSPELKRVYANIMKGKLVSILYNPYKSDVYSLGLTFLFMCNLGPSDELTDLSNLIRNTNDVISTLRRCEKIKQLLQTMLRAKCNDRSDFITLEREFCEPAPVAASAQYPAVYWTQYETDPQLQHEEDYLGMLNSDNLPDIQQALNFCFPQIPLNVQCSMMAQCWKCFNTYQIDLLSEYTVEYLYFCSQYCYCSYYQESGSQTSTISVCMQCQKQFVPNTDWHISVQRSSPKFQLDLNTLCSIQCYHSIIQGLEEGTNAPPFSKKARPQYANMPRLPAAVLRNQSRAQHSRFQGNGGLKKAKQRPENFEEAQKSTNPATLNIFPQIMAKRYREACTQCNKPKKPFLRCSGTRRTSDGKLLTHSFCENCSSVDGFDTKKCPMCVKVSISMKS